MFSGKCSTKHYRTLTIPKKYRYYILLCNGNITPPEVIHYAAIGKILVWPNRTLINIKSNFRDQSHFHMIQCLV